jgi:hypothetical protein
MAANRGNFIKCLAFCAALTLFGANLLSPTPTLAEDRTLDGSGNNLANPQWGAMNTPMTREASGYHYSDGIWGPAGSTRPSARVISNAVLAQNDLSIPDPRGMTALVSFWAQYVAHDISLRVERYPLENMYVDVPTGDPQFDPFSAGGKTIPFYRSDCAVGTGPTTANPCEQVNRVNAWLDASTVYGNGSYRGDWLRSNVGGRLKITPHASGDLLPFNDESQVMDSAFGPTTDPSFFVAGDDRANQQSGLIALHTLFLREHNYQASQIATANPSWTDEQIFQRARRIVAAEIQAVTYNEYLPAMLGPHGVPEYTGYDPLVNPSISNAFATVGFRIGHSLTSPTIRRVDVDGNEYVDGDLQLRDSFFNNSVIVDQGGVDPILRGLSMQVEQKIDAYVIDDIRNVLFGPPGAGGLDLASLDIQRGRDHGVADYNTMRADFGLPRVTSFAEITSDTRVQAALASVYASVDDIDAWVGALAEDHLPGASVGPLVAAITVDQFARLRDGDRFWYENDAEFSAAEIAAIRDTQLADIMMRNVAMTHPELVTFRAIPEPTTGVLAALGAFAFAVWRRRRMG